MAVGARKMSSLDELLARGEADKLLPLLEVAELDAASCQKAHPYAAAHLLCLLLNDNLCEARFLWRRLPLTARQDPAVSSAWSAARALWEGQHGSFYAAAKSGNWPAELQGLVDQVLGRVREQAVESVRVAYQVISVDRLAWMVGVDTAEVSSICARLGWTVEDAYVVVNRESGRRDVGLGIELQTLTEQLVRLQTSQ